MRKFILLAVMVFGFTSLSATYYRGGDLTWTCLGNGKYIFHLNRYVDCSIPQGFPSSPTIQGPQGSIALTWYNTKNASACPDQIGGCGLSHLGQGPVEVRQYKSNTVTLTGSPPPGGWAFNYIGGCCRESGIVNLINPVHGTISLKSIMYPSPNGCSSSPYFDVNTHPTITSKNRSIEAHAYSENSEDSLYYSFGPPRDQNQTAILPGAGYTYQNPFPNVNHNPANGNVSLNRNTGMISYKSVSGINGVYAFVVVVEQWRNNKLLSIITREYGMPANYSGFTNNPPIVTIDTAMYPKIQKIDPIHYVVHAGVGDTIDFEIQGIDSDVDPQTLQYPNVTFDINGPALDTTWKDSSVYTNIAVLSYAAPQTSFTHRHANKVRFSWVLANEHVGRAVTSHQFVFRFHDNRCDSSARVGMQHVLLEVKLHANQGIITKDTLNICKGDSAHLNAFTLSGLYQWSPSVGLSSDTVSDPMSSPATSQYYYLTDPTNPGFIDSVYVDVASRGYFNLAFTNGQMTLTDSAQTTNRVWYYNGIPFNYPSDTLTPFGLGDYYVIGKSGVCQYVSNTISITAGMSFSVTAPNNGGYAGTPAVVTGALGVTFQVNQNVNVNWVSIPGITDVYGKTGGYDLNLKVYDNTQTEMFNTNITIARPIDNVLKVPANLNLMANQDYTVVVRGDTGYAFSFYDNMALPATPQNVGFTVKALLGGNANQFPTTPVTYALPISLGIDKTVSLDEISGSAWSIYPNPAKEQIHIVGLVGAESIHLMDMNGKVIKSFAIEKNQIEITLSRDNISSGLYFIKVQFENSTSLKKVLFE